MLDQHYHHLPRLWDAAKSDPTDRLPTPGEIAGDRMQLQKDYSKYVGVVLSKALLKHSISFGTARRVGVAAGLGRAGLDWLLTHSSGTSLRIVPCWSVAALDDSIQVSPDVVVCVPELKGIPAVVGDALPSFVQISPLDLYVVERFGEVVDQWLGRCAGRNYAQSLAKIPSAVSEELKAWKGRAVEVDGSSVRVLAPGTSAERERALSVARQTGSAQTVEALANAFAAASSLSTCPECGSTGIMAPGRHKTFWATCSVPSCQSSWGIQRQGARRTFRLEPKNAASLQEFLAVGRSRFAIRLD